ncbi:hypothetical protein PspLS_04794 [Pyricularia sp. CBS 133598]|nr:hypothetical protein PspLS_04794 [Pyricularia sp. CBS 133598]
MDVVERPPAPAACHDVWMPTPLHLTSSALHPSRLTMRFSTAFFALVSVGFSSASGFRLQGRDQVSVALDDDHKIPGESPLKLCDGDHKDDILKITKVDLSPNPPKAGESLVIKASGDVTQKIEDGAYINLSVKYGLIRLINTKADLCEQIKNVDLDCPIDEGKLDIVKSVDLPNEIPPGKYTVFADVYTKDNKKISCLTAEVRFERNSIATPWGDL